MFRVLSFTCNLFLQRNGGYEETFLIASWKASVQEEINLAYREAQPRIRNHL